MNTDQPNETAVDAGLVACWKDVGMWGSRDCPELTKVGHCHNCAVFSRAARQLQDRPVPAGYREEWTRHLAEPLVEHRHSTVLWLTFRLGNERLAVPLSVVTEVMEKCAVHHLPHRHSAVLRGLVNVRGELVLCVSLAALLGIESVPDNPKARPRILVLKSQHGRYCLLADEVMGTVDIAANERQPLPATIGRAQAHHTEAVVNRDGNTIGCLSVARLFAALDEVIK